MDAAAAAAAAVMGSVLPMPAVLLRLQLRRLFQQMQMHQTIRRLLSLNLPNVAPRMGEALAEVHTIDRRHRVGQTVDA